MGCKPVGARTSQSCYVFKARQTLRPFETVSRSALDVDDFDAIAFGCPAMGVEQLEEDEFEPMWEDVKENLSDKKVAFFGSYGWGDGEWMRTWTEEAEGLNITLVSEPVICNYEPDDDGIEACQALGAALAE